MDEFNASGSAPRTCPPRPRSPTPTPGSPASSEPMSSRTRPSPPSASPYGAALADLDAGRDGRSSPAPAAPTPWRCWPPPCFEARKDGLARGRRDRRPRAPGGLGRAGRAGRRRRWRRSAPTRRSAPGSASRAAGSGPRRRPARRGTPCSSEVAERFDGRGRAARPHPRRPGRDGAARPGPRLGRPVAGRDAPLVRRLSPAAARRRAGRHRRRLRGRGHRVLGRPAQRRPGVHPGAGADAVLPMLEEQLGPGVAGALARTADQLRADMELLDDLADAALRRPRSTTA